MKNARYGIYNGMKAYFTHYNPKRHMAWSEDLGLRKVDGTITWGVWVSYDSIKWC